MTILDQEYPQHLEYASFGERLFARLIDFIVLIIPGVLFPLVAPWLYFAIQEGSENGATVGKRAMNIRVLSVESRPIGFGTATGRFFAHFLNFFMLGIGYFLMLFNARSQCLHDMIAGTVVVKNTSGYRPAAQPKRQDTKIRKWTAQYQGETYIVEIDATGGRYRRIGGGGEQVSQFTLWQLTDGLKVFSHEFGQEAYLEMQQYAEKLMRQAV